MLRQKANLIARIVYIVDLALTTLAFFTAFFLRNLIFPLLAPEHFPTGLYPLSEYLKIYPIVLIIWSVLLFTYHSYHSHRTIPVSREALTILRVVVLGNVILATLAYLLPLRQFSRAWFLLFGLFSALFLLLEPIDEIVFAVTRKKLDEMKQIFLYCEELGIRTRVAMNFFQNRVARIEIEQLEGIPFLTFTTTPSNETQLAFKRLLDIGISSSLLVLASPVILIAALCIKMSSPGSVLFKQRRVGLNGRGFTLYKFRTMIADAHERRGEVHHLNEMNGPVFKAKGDPRVTPIGRVLRKFSLDELPQLWNVF